MADNLLIVESPAKAKTIQKYLGKDFVVKSSFGHIRDLKEKSLSIDIKNGFTPEYVVQAGKKKLVDELKKAAAQVQTVWLASDEDLEGEAISWHLSETLGLDPTRTHRIVFHEITKDAIQHAIQNPRSIDMGRVNAQQARRVLDRLVGFELSPILWRKIQKGLSAGRVQSVALRLVVDREREINAFQAEAYYKVEAVFDAFGVKVKGSLDRKFQTIEEARAFLEDCIGANYTVASIQKKEGARHPAPPFTTSTLQQEAARKLRFSVSNTMRIAQSLYERGLISYMRTDSTNLSNLALQTAKQFIIENFGPQYQHSRQFKTRAKGAQEAHEAIRPSYIANTDIEGSPEEKKLYQLIWKRTIASQMEDAKTLNTSIKVACDKRSEQYSLQATEILFDGFLKVYKEGTDDESTEEEIIIPTGIKTGDTLKEISVSAECKFTQAPYRYSEASLVKKLEELGIGRPSTYASIISTLTTRRGYIAKGNKEGKKVSVTNLLLQKGKISENTKTENIGAEKGKFLPQEIGIIVTDYLMGHFSEIMDYDFTANVEKSLDSVAEGELKWNEVIADFYGPFHGIVENSLSDGHYSHVERVLGIDPVSGETLTAKFGQYGPYVQKGEGENRQHASLSGGLLIETITLEEALKLFELPRNLGAFENVDVIVLKGRYGPYLKHGDKNISMPRGMDPMTISLDQAIQLITNKADNTSNTTIVEFKEQDIAVLRGKYGPYIKHSGSNYKIPAGTNAETLSLEDCNKIIAESTPTTRKSRFKKQK